MPLSSAEMDYSLPPEEAVSERGQADQLEAMIIEKLGKSIRDLRVHIRNGVAVITGSASSYYAKQLATHVILGEMQVSNEIAVL